MNAIQRLIYLAHIKNDLNRKRHRFYYYMNPPKKWDVVKGEWKDIAGKKHITPGEAAIGYRMAQCAMKAMTVEMRKMRVEMGATFKWNNSGMIESIRWSGNKLGQKHFKRYYEAELFEMGLFKE